MAGKWDHLDLNKLVRSSPVRSKKKSVKKITVKKTKIYRSVHKCKICGRQFGSSSAKERHMQGHYARARKDGLTPVFRTTESGREEFARFKTKSSPYDIF